MDLIKEYGIPPNGANASDYTASLENVIECVNAQSKSAYGDFLILFPSKKAELKVMQQSKGNMSYNSDAKLSQIKETWVLQTMSDQ